MKIRDFIKCNFCPDTTDYVEHFFYECRISKSLWRHIENIIAVRVNKRTNLDVMSVLFGISNSDILSKAELKIANLYLLIGKLCISKYKYGKPIAITILFD